MQGRIIKGIAGFYYVQNGADIFECKAKGIFRKDQKKPLVGDFVTIEILDESEKKGNITEILERKNTLFRPAVANVDQAAVVFACKDPIPNCNLLDRFLITMESFSLPTIICFTKADLINTDERKKLEDIYGKTGYEICFLSSRLPEDSSMRHFRELLEHKVTAFAGPSGVGKSSLLNYLCPEAAMETGEISEKIKRGKHTTRHSELFCLGDQTYLFDTPGFSSLDITGLEKEQLEFYFPEFEAALGKCRFYGCTHITEPSCAVKELLAEDKIHEMRYENYKLFYKELAAIKKYGR